MFKQLLAGTALVCLALATGCKSNSSSALTKHPEYPRLRKEMAETVAIIRKSEGLPLYRALRKLVAYDLFALDVAKEMLEDPNARIRSNAVWVLGQIPPDPSFPEESAELVDSLEDALEDMNRLVRYEAACALLLRNDWNVIPLLLRGLEDEDAAVRMSCHDVLRMATSENFGFRADDPLDRRQDAVARWRGWYDDWERSSG